MHGPLIIFMRDLIDDGFYALCFLFFFLFFVHITSSNNLLFVILRDQSSMQLLYE